jgi:hypothetical protein
MANLPEPKRGSVTVLTVGFALVPVCALTIGIPFVNRLEPRILGLPFLLAWIVGWTLLTPVCMSLVHWLASRRR